MLQVWELSDLDRDGMLDRDEFAVVRNRFIIKVERYEEIHAGEM